MKKQQPPPESMPTAATVEQPEISLVALQDVNPNPLKYKIVDRFTGEPDNNNNNLQHCVKTGKATWEVAHLTKHHLMRDTGEVDKDGKPIFEGDHILYGNKPSTQQVRFHSACFWVKDKPLYQIMNQYNVEIVKTK